MVYINDIFEHLEQAVYALALVHNGKVGIKCSNCSSEFKKDNNCLLYHKLNEIDQEMDIFYSPAFKLTFTVCPISFIPNIIYELYDQYAFVNKFNSPIDYTTCSALFWWFTKTYDYATQTIQLYDMEQEKRKNKGKRR